MKIFEAFSEFEPREITALLGAHTFGRRTFNDSGYTGRWVEESASMSNVFYQDLIKKTWKQQVLENGQHQWTSRSNDEVAMLNADLSLIYFLQEGPNACIGTSKKRGRRFRYPRKRWREQFWRYKKPANPKWCSLITTPTRKFVYLYARSERRWLRDFVKAWVKMQEMGQGDLQEAR